MADRLEVALIQPDLDFLDLSPGMAAVRKTVIGMTNRQRRLCWLALTAQPENIREVVKEGSFANRVENLCVGLVSVAVDDGLDARLEALRSISSRYKMLFLHSLEREPDLHGKLGGLHWLVLCTAAINNSWAQAAKAECQAANVAFLHLDQDNPSGFHVCLEESATVGQKNEPAWHEHPFGPAVLLRRPTLKGLEQSVQFTLNLSHPEPPKEEQDRVPTSVAKSSNSALNPVAMAASSAAEVITNPTVVEVLASPQDPIEATENAFASSDTPEEDAVAIELKVCGGGNVRGTYVIRENVRHATSGNLEPLRLIEPCAETVASEVKYPRIIKQPVEPVKTITTLERPDEQQLLCVIDPVHSSNADLTEFRRLDEIVVKGVEAGMEAGVALMKIRDRKLWKVAGYRTWNDYCEKVRGLTRQYVNDQIRAADTRAKILQVESILSTSPDCVPRNVAQVKELYPLKDPEKQAQACLRAAELEQGALTATSLRDVVAEMMADGDNTRKIRPTDRKAQLAQKFEQLRAAVTANYSHETLLGLIGEIQKLAK